MKAICCAGVLGELASTGSVIRMNVSVKHVANLQFLGLGEGDVGFDVTFLRVDDRACANGPSAEGIGGASCVVIIEGLEKHLADSPAREGGVDSSLPQCAARSIAAVPLLRGCALRMLSSRCRRPKARFFRT
jgi:hypothetical protein